MKIFNEEKHRAFNHTVDSINSSMSFPDQVFRGHLDKFLFFESDRLFAPGFALVMAELLRIERAKIFCLLNFSEMKRGADESAVAIFLDIETGSRAYGAMLRQGGAAMGWLYGMDRYGGSSDLGGWSLYCEKDNDIAAIAFRQPNDAVRYAECLRQLHAKPIAALLDAGSSANFPFSQLIDSWHHSLSQCYS